MVEKMEHKTLQTNFGSKSSRYFFKRGFSVGVGLKLMIRWRGSPSKEDDRRITDHPTFQAHLLGRSGKTGLWDCSYSRLAKKRRHEGRRNPGKCRKNQNPSFHILRIFQAALVSKLRNHDDRNARTRWAHIRAPLTPIKMTLGKVLPHPFSSFWNVYWSGSKFRNHASC